MPELNSSFKLYEILLKYEPNRASDRAELTYTATKFFQNSHFRDECGEIKIIEMVIKIGVAILQIIIIEFDRNVSNGDIDNRINGNFTKYAFSVVNHFTSDMYGETMLL